MEQVEVDKQAKMNDLEVEKIKKLDDLRFNRELTIAKLCVENPTYASFLVSKELAGKVQIAVLPSNSNGDALGNLLKNLTISPLTEEKTKEDN